MASAIGAVLAFGKGAASAATTWRERRDLYPQGVASGDPGPRDFSVRYVSLQQLGKGRG